MSQAQLREPMSEITNSKSIGQVAAQNSPKRPGTAGKVSSRPLSVFRSTTSSSYKAPEIFNDPNAAVNNELKDDSLLRIMRADILRKSDRLIALTERGDHAAVEALLQEGADLPNCSGLHGFTPLHHACSRSQSAVVSILIKYGADIGSRNHAGETPLHLAAYRGNLLVVEQLIDCGADINAVNLDGESTLFYAARQSKPALVRLLLQRGASPHLVDRFGDTALDQAEDARTCDALKNTDESITTTGTTSSSPASRLPYTELLHIFRYLDVKDVGKASMVAGKWHRVSESEELWRALGVRRWELALQSTLGFGTTAAATFGRPSSGGSKKEKKQATST